MRLMVAAAVGLTSFHHHTMFFQVERPSISNDKMAWRVLSNGGKGKGHQMFMQRTGGF